MNQAKACLHSLLAPLQRFNRYTGSCILTRTYNPASQLACETAITCSWYVGGESKSKQRFIILQQPQSRTCLTASSIFSKRRGSISTLYQHEERSLMIIPPLFLSPQLSRLMRHIRSRYSSHDRRQLHTIRSVGVLLGVYCRSAGRTNVCIAVVSLRSR